MTSMHRYLVVLDIESPERLEDRDLAAAWTGDVSVPELPCVVAVVATVLSSTNLASPFRVPYTSLADVIERRAPDKRA